MGNQGHQKEIYIDLEINSFPTSVKSWFFAAPLFPNACAGGAQTSRFRRRKSLKNHRKIIRKILENCRPFLGHFDGKYVWIICLKAPGNYSASTWYHKISICLWEKLNLLISMISGFLNASPSPKTKHLKQIKTNPQTF